MIVVDASVLVNVLADDEADGDRARARVLADPDLHAPSLVDLEVLAVLRRHLNAGTLNDRRAGLAIDDLHELPLTRYPHLAMARRIWKHRSNLTAYDAAYVALAELLGCPLVTADQKLAGAPGLTCPVEQL
ncbi:MAG: type II toxin-antitoxin system VapC family toxin [Pseudonocardiaceae bacterium]